MYEIVKDYPSMNTLHANLSEYGTTHVVSFFRDSLEKIEHTCTISVEAVRGRGERKRQTEREREREREKERKSKREEKRERKKEREQMGGKFLRSALS